MKFRRIANTCLVGLLMSGCVIETRPSSTPNSTGATTQPQPPPPPPPPATGGTTTTPGETTTTPDPIPDLPPPTGVREGMRPRLRRAPLPPDKNDPPPVAKPLPPQPPPQAPPKTTPHPVPTYTGIGDGVAAPTPGSPPAYWVWRTPEGVWKLRTTTGNTYQKFHGLIVLIKDRLSQLRITRTELERRVDVKGPYISFDFATEGQVEGIDFVTELPDSCVHFQLYVEPNPAPKKIFIGPGAVQPSYNHFVLCPTKK